MESKEERLLKAIFSNAEDDESEDNYPETITEKVGYVEYVMTHGLQNIGATIYRLSRLHSLLMTAEKSGESKLPNIITNNELRMALKPLLQVENDIKDVVEMLTEVYRETKPQQAGEGGGKHETD